MFVVTVTMLMFIACFLAYCSIKSYFNPKYFVLLKLVASKYLYDDGEDDDAYNYDWCKAGLAKHVYLIGIYIYNLC